MNSFTILKHRAFTIKLSVSSENPSQLRDRVSNKDTKLLRSIFFFFAIHLKLFNNHYFRFLLSIQLDFETRLQLHCLQWVPKWPEKPLKQQQFNIILKSKLKFRQCSPTRWISCMPKTVLVNQHSRKSTADIQHIFQINTWMRGLGFSISFVHRYKQTFLTVLFIQKHWWFQNEPRIGTHLV